MGKQAEEMTMVRGNDSDDGSFSWKRKIFSACFPGDDENDDCDDDDDDDDDDQRSTSSRASSSRSDIKCMSAAFL